LSGKFHPAFEDRLDADWRLNLFQVGVSDVLFDLQPRVVQLCLGVGRGGLSELREVLPACCPAGPMPDSDWLDAQQRNAGPQEVAE
jgi:hypothetical protein